MTHEILLVVDHFQQGKPLPPPEQAIYDRVTKQLGYAVQVLDWQSPIPAEVGLVVVCSKQATRELRELPKPVLVCNVTIPSVLYDMGMTNAQPGSDFGTQVYSSVLI